MTQPNVAEPVEFASAAARSLRARLIGEAPTVDSLVQLAVSGLPAMLVPGRALTVQTVRGAPGGGAVVREGLSLRYSAMTALGVSRLPEAEQRAALDGRTAADLSRESATGARGDEDPGAVALAAWALAEVEGTADEVLLARLEKTVCDAGPIDTVVVAWSLVAGLAAAGLTDTRRLVDRSASLLLGAQRSSGLFPHELPAAARGPRGHVGCFADQVYPIQALARLHAASGDRRALDAANRCAWRICALQGEAGQWWWHYDIRDGSVVEGYPVYSVHQHAMGPMALLELVEAGGDDHLREIALGLQWLQTHPETPDELVDRSLSVIWRKVGRREPAKAVRRVSALTTAVRPGLVMPGLDRLFPPGPVDRECRPYELGWLLYAWLADGVASTQPRPVEARVTAQPDRDAPAVVDAPGRTGRVNVLGVRFDALTMAQAVDRCRAALARREPTMIGVVNAAKAVNVRRDPLLRQSLRDCDLMLADGMSVVWASRVLGTPLPERVTGIDLFEQLLALADRDGHSVYLLGAEPDVLAELIRRLAVRFPGLRVAGSRDGYFQDDEAATVAQDIRSSGADMLFIGMASPRKENFLAAYADMLDVPIMHGVGGSFDVLAGVTQRAPEAWQRRGLEWAYRLHQEPRRMWRRYLETNTMFVLLLLRELALRRWRPLPVVNP